MSTPVAATTVTPKRGGTLKTGSAQGITSLEPHLSLAWQSSETTWLPYDRLTAYDLNLNPQPMLAESWDVSNDATGIQLNIRKNVQFHTGRELTSDDVKYSILRVRDPGVGAGQFTNQSNWFTTVDTPDKYTVTLRSDQPRPSMFDLFEYLNIVDKNTVEGPDAKTASVGTGPFKFVEWSAGDHFTLARNDSYWQSGRPLLDGVEARFFRDTQAMTVQLEAGAIDAMTLPLRQDFIRLRSNPGYQALTHPNGGTWYLVGINTGVPPFDNKLVRQAMNYAIDRNRFVESVLLGIGSPQDLPWADSSPGAEPAKNQQYTFDLDKARTLLSQAGVSSLTTDLLPVPGQPEGGPFAEIYQADLAKIGVTVNIVNMDIAAWVDQANNRKYHSLYFASNSTPGAQLSPPTLFNAKPLDPNNNNSAFKSDGYSQLVAAAAAEADPTRSKQLISQLNDMVLDESFSIPLSPTLLTKVARAAVHEITPNMHTGWMFTDTWIDA